MGDWCHAMGIPEDKIIVLPNACGYPLDDTLKNEILARKWGQRNNGRLKVLFIGRFDRQKGLDRLLGIVNTTRNLDLPIHWRLVGKNVIQHEDAASELDSISDLIEPPIFDQDGLNEVYEWADVLILPSYWEGLPLTILEAMRLGVVVLASDVGAVSEAIDHGENGFLVPNLQGGGFVPTVIKYLSDLAENPAQLKQMSLKAAKAAQKRSWEQSCAKLRDIWENSEET
jgi:glycosyltransferase involved in cell wall biosynthesis